MRSSAGHGIDGHPDTGPDFIGSNFTNLAQGQAVTLNYNGITYNFVANYYGGTGNDLVLVWAETRAMAWGLNADGQLGDRSLTSRNTPVSVFEAGVLTGKTIISVAAGGIHSLAKPGEYFGSLAFSVDSTDGMSGTLSTQASGGTVIASFGGQRVYAKTKSVPPSLLNTPAAKPTKGIYSGVFRARDQVPAVDLLKYPQGDGYASSFLGRRSSHRLRGADAFLRGSGGVTAG